MSIFISSCVGNKIIFVFVFELLNFRIGPPYLARCVDGVVGWLVVLGLTAL